MPDATARRPRRRQKWKGCAEDSDVAHHADTTEQTMLDTILTSASAPPHTTTPDVTAYTMTTTRRGQPGTWLMTTRTRRRLNYNYHNDITSSQTAEV